MASAEGAGRLCKIPRAVQSDRLKSEPSGLMMSKYCIWTTLYRKRKYCCIVWFHNIIFSWKTHIYHHLCKWVFFITSYSSNIMWIVSSMNTTCTIYKL